MSQHRGKLDQHQLLDLMDDVTNQPDWRSLANRACAYYDGDQLEPEVKRVLVERGQPATVHNLIAPTIDGVLGMEAKSRTDLMVISDDADDEMEAMAEAVNAEYQDACRLGGVDRARADAYGDQIKAGVGWAEVVRSDDPFGPKYKASRVHRDEVYWDWHSRQSDLSDCRWLMRRRWVDVDECKSRFPSKAEVIDYSVRDWSGFVDVTSAEGLDPALVSGYDEWQSFDQRSCEWMSSNRKRVLLQVIYYRTFERRKVLMLESGRALEYDQHDMAQLIALQLGRAQLETRPVSVIREAWWVGPHHLADRPCDAPYGMFPLVPFWGYRKDRSGEPYGLIARAMPAQDEVNLRRIKLTWLLQAKRVIMDKDATNMPRERVLEEVERADGLIELNPDRRNGKTIAEAFQVQQDFQVAGQQFQVMQDSVKLIQDTMGVYAAFLGQGATGQSGVAISNLVEQGGTTLSEINDNYRFGCQQLGQLILGMVMEDLAKRPNYPVTVNRDDRQKRKQVVLNQSNAGGTGEGINNDVTRLRAHIALAPIQHSAVYKQQLAERMTQAVSQLPPEAQAATFDLLVELMDVPNKAEFMERIRSTMNIPKKPEEMTPEEQQAAEAQAQQAQAEQELAMREIQAKVAEVEAKAAKWQAEAQRVAILADSQRYDNAHKQAQTGKTLQEMERIAAEKGRIEQEAAGIQAQLLQTIEQQIDAIQL
ncbi:hypothetical protein HNR62_001039 [Oceanisphaera litoralis]|uniref:portal protein n=1 Tax=Oceanisphaera litoralis TaxID=225144 RepID=UPI00195E6070|nr:portal protein [Oceanisphaera litoralis]MBM7455179.1 hypothetical protein [Oceanisphaera litoralis]